MSRVGVPAIGPGCAERNPDVAHLFPRRSDSAAVQALSVPGKRKSRDPERDLQDTCERYLSLRGYLRMTADEACSLYQGGRQRCQGWYGHLVKAKGNPFMPDLFVFKLDRPPLLVELKTRDVYQPGQREMIEMGYWKLAFRFDEFLAHFRVWEASDGWAMLKAERDAG